MAEKKVVQYSSSFESGSAGGAGDPQAAARKLQLACVLIAVAILLLLFRSCSCEKEQTGNVTTVTHRLQNAAVVLGAHLATVAPGSDLLLITSPRNSNDYRQDMIEAIQAGIETGAGGKCKIRALDAPVVPSHVVEAIRAKRGDEAADNWNAPLDAWFTADVLRETIERHPECSVAVSMVGLPDDFESVIPDEENLLRPAAKLAVLGGPLPDAAVIEKAFAKGVLLGAVVPRGDTEADLPAGLADDVQAEFARHHKLLTAENTIPAAKGDPSRRPTR